MSLFYHRRPSFEIFTDFFSYSQCLGIKSSLLVKKRKEQKQSDDPADGNGGGPGDNSSHNIIQASSHITLTTGNIL